MKHVFIYLSIFTVFSFQGLGQDSLDISGQLSGYINYAPDNDLNVMSGLRYLPEANYGIEFKNEKQLDLEAAANIYGNIMLHPFDSSFTEGSIKPYRLWIRFTGKQFELRLGLQISMISVQR